LGENKIDDGIFVVLGSGLQLKNPSTPCSVSSSTNLWRLDLLETKEVVLTFQCCTTGVIIVYQGCEQLEIVSSSASASCSSVDASGSPVGGEVESVTFVAEANVPYFVSFSRLETDVCTFAPTTTSPPTELPTASPTECDIHGYGSEIASVGFFDVQSVHIGVRFVAGTGAENVMLGCGDSGNGNTRVVRTTSDQLVTIAIEECCGTAEISVFRGCDSRECIAKHRTVSCTSNAVVGGNFDVVERTGVDFYAKAGVPYFVVFVAKGQCPSCTCPGGFGIFNIR
jgi:hypothetical protein